MNTTVSFCDVMNTAPGLIFDCCDFTSATKGKRGGEKQKTLGKGKGKFCKARFCGEKRSGVTSNLDTQDFLFDVWIESVEDGC